MKNILLFVSLINTITYAALPKMIVLIDNRFSDVEKNVMEVREYYDDEDLRNNADTFTMILENEAASFTKTVYKSSKDAGKLVKTTQKIDEMPEFRYQGMMNALKRVTLRFEWMNICDGETNLPRRMKFAAYHNKKDLVHLDHNSSEERNASFLAKTLYEVSQKTKSAEDKKRYEEMRYHHRDIVNRTLNNLASMEQNIRLLIKDE